MRSLATGLAQDHVAVLALAAHPQVAERAVEVDGRLLDSHVVALLRKQDQVAVRSVAAEEPIATTRIQPDAILAACLAQDHIAVKVLAAQAQVGEGCVEMDGGEVRSAVIASRREQNDVAVGAVTAEKETPVRVHLHAALAAWPVHREVAVDARASQPRVAGPPFRWIVLSPSVALSPEVANSIRSPSSPLPPNHTLAAPASRRM